jgi:hypothetical protein
VLGNERSHGSALRARQFPIPPLNSEVSNYLAGLMQARRSATRDTDAQSR